MAHQPPTLVRQARTISTGEVVQDLESLRNAAHTMALALEDLRFELAALLPGLSDAQLDRVAGQMAASAISKGS